MTNAPKIINSAATAPFGYCWQDGGLVLDAAEADIRRQMYELFLKHRRKKTVARLLNEAGFRTRGGALFSDTAVDRMLRDSSAKGICNLTSGGKIRETTIEPIVSLETWEQVNSILNNPQKLGKQTVQLFAGLVYCRCGGKMNVPSNSPKYVCAACRRKIESSDLEEIFQAQLAAFPLPPMAATSQRVTASTPQTLADCWQVFTKDEKRVVIEQLTRRIVIGERDIHIEYGILPDSFKTMATGQQQPQPAAGQQNSLTLPKDESEEQRTNQSVVRPIIETDSRQQKTTEPQRTESPATEPEQTGQTGMHSLSEPLMNETDAAKFLGISRMTLLRKRNAGEIKFFRVGFRVLYSKEKHLIPFLASCETETRKI